ncbi:LAQU0S03e03664g1_1 [Lachancea quebecensis]|uniref:Pre-mRNA-splicing factor SLT11 n=1 Tax=Lachancea quebecensis TaxID=1654605 RepID=A0A0P1KRI6_9SACH|nr:LAQU0S03e03664g1_1 [Lachancea quebecensis]
MEPAICKTCLGDQVRLTRAVNGAECKICTLPFTVYHFKAHQRINRTVVCYNCSKQRNVCQCCLLDLQWQIPVELRDRVLSLIQGSEVATHEAQNEMMKRFIALKDGDSFKMGGASVTSSASATADALKRIRDTVEAAENSGKATDAAEPGRDMSSSKNLADVDITQLLKKLPLKGSLSDGTSFFLYNIDPSVAEWAIVDAVTELVGTPSWKDPVSTSVIINHTARCGGIRFKTPELAQRFINQVPAFKTEAGTTKGKLLVQNSRVHVVSWPQFNRAALGTKHTECLKLGASLDKVVQKDLSSPAAAKTTPIKKQGKVTKKASSSKDKKRNKRITDIEL